MRFMQESVDDDEIILYASMRGVMIHSVLVPRESVDPLDSEDLREWGCGPFDCWSMGSDGSIEPPLSHSSSKTLAQGEQLIFRRSFDGFADNRHYIEVSQQFTHVLKLHHMPERRAWCRIDRDGEIERVVRLVSFDEPSQHPAGTVVLIKRWALAEYTVPQDLVLLRMFEFQRYKGESDPFQLRTGLESENVHEDPLIFFRLLLDAGYASIGHGVQVAFINKHEGKLSSTEGQYATFTAQEFNSEEVRDISPSSSAFRTSSITLPHDFSSAFFRPEVLQKYKQDYEKYTLEGRSICRRDGWRLEHYDINEEGQVHTYLKSLWRLPYEEQKHWSHYNEPPKAPVSRQSYEADIRGNFCHGEADSLTLLKEFLSKIQCKWWVLPRNDMLNRVHCPVTTSTKEWADELLNLDQLLIEGLCEPWLKSQAKALGGRINPQVRTIGLIRECLVGAGFSKEDSKSRVSPLYRLHDHRNKLRAHETHESAKALKQAAISEFGTYRQHYTHIVNECLVTFKFLSDFFRTLVENSSERSDH